MQTVDRAAVRIMVYGRVQGVYFRAFAAQKARSLGLKGYAQNVPRGDAVEIVAEGERRRLEELITHLNVGPPAARVEKVYTSWSAPSGRYADFSIR